MYLWQQTSLISAGNAAYLEQLYEAYLKNSALVPAAWTHYFEQLPMVNNKMPEPRHLEIQAEFKAMARQACFRGSRQISTGSPVTGDLQILLLQEKKQAKVHELINAYRLLGHLQADIDPLKLRAIAVVAELMLSYYHFSEADLKTQFEAGTLPGPIKRSLQKIVEDLKRIYCGTVAAEFMHIPDSPERIWVQEQVEALNIETALPVSVKRRILSCLISAEGLEKYLSTKYPGAKRFSIEGTDSLIVALDTVIQRSSRSGVREVILGMAHRGRLNVLVNLLGKAPSQLFEEFEEKHHEVKLETGDVKYHQGFSSNMATEDGTLHLSLEFNPSHLEIVTPVVYGSVKARQVRRKDKDYSQVLSVAVHGDAAFSGQGVVMETLNMSQARGFKIGGTLHIIVNNQIGFTTSNVHDARSTLYCSDLGKMLEVPILHVNADDPEAVFRVMELAFQYRLKFKKAIIIDLVGYRRQGHNEADEPAVTQPHMYKIIRNLPTVCKKYADKLIAENVLSREEVDQQINAYRDALDQNQNTLLRNMFIGFQHEYGGDWQNYLNKDWRAPAKTAVPVERLKELGEKQTTLPPGFVLHPRLQKIIEDRRKMTAEALPLDWGYAETLAYATLLQEGYLVRLTGQDVGRGAFFHRQAVLYNQSDDTEYIPLCHLEKKQGTFMIINSLLSEVAVLAFEYGFAKTEPRGLIIWEAQFGDFANNAQVVIDQFISSGEQKWGKLCGLTLFLPHGYEGQGPEHSSARLERYLQLCAGHNIQVCIPSTPAQMFHLLRRQVIRPMRKPLIILTPKSLLRHKLATSTLQELAEGTFLTVLPELDKIVPEATKQIILCSGKIYYELLEKRRADKREDVIIARIEQLYPFPETELQALLTQYSQATDIVWCQEEPKNQGAWYNIHHHLIEVLGKNQVLRYAGREAAAAPAVGYHYLHQEQQLALVKDALR